MGRVISTGCRTGPRPWRASVAWYPPLAAPGLPLRPPKPPTYHLGRGVRCTPRWQAVRLQAPQDRTDDPELFYALIQCQNVILLTCRATAVAPESLRIDRSPQTTSAPIRAMSQLGQSLPKRDVRVTPAHPSISDMMLRRRLGRNGPNPDVHRGLQRLEPIACAHHRCRMC